MVRISVTIPVYNEIRFIQKTLESVIGEADEIILSDNASTDGTSDICQSFADKYPEIKYTRHKENTGAMNNYYFCQNQITGKYIRSIGAHDMISIGSNQSMASLLDKNPDVVMVYPKYAINLKEDYSFLKCHSFDEFGNGALSDSAFIRVENMSNYKDICVYYGLWRTEDFRNFINSRIFQSNCTDVTMLLASATKGKFLADERSIFFRMIQYDKMSVNEHQKRYAKMFSPSSSTDDVKPTFWHFAIIAESYDLLLEKFSENPQFCWKILHSLLRRFSTWLEFDYKLENMPPIIPEKLEFCQNLINIIKKYHVKENCKKKILETDKKIFLFGSGITSHNTLNSFPKNAKWSAFIENDNSKIGKPDVLPIISFQEFIENSKDTLVLITSTLYGDEMRRQLIDNGFSEDSIVVLY